MRCSCLRQTGYYWAICNSIALYFHMQIATRVRIRIYYKTEFAILVIIGLVAGFATYYSPPYYIYCELLGLPIIDRFTFIIFYCLAALIYLFFLIRSVYRAFDFSRNTSIRRLPSFVTAQAVNPTTSVHQINSERAEETSSVPRRSRPNSPRTIHPSMTPSAVHNTNAINTIPSHSTTPRRPQQQRQNSPINESITTSTNDAQSQSSQQISTSQSHNQSSEVIIDVVLLDQININDNENLVKCPFCQSLISQGEETFKCPACDCIQHTDCWEENSFRCAIFGCVGVISSTAIRRHERGLNISNDLFTQTSHASLNDNSLQNEQIVYITQTGQCYHQYRYCGAIINREVTYISLHDALRARYRRCGRC